MASVSWPQSLPQYVLVDGYAETPPNIMLRTEMAAGPAKVRRRATADARPIVCRIRVDAAGRAALDAFYLVDTKAGSLAFDWVHPITRAACEMRFRAPPDYAAGDAVRVTATLQLEIMP